MGAGYIWYAPRTPAYTSSLDGNGETSDQTDVVTRKSHHGRRSHANLLLRGLTERNHGGVEARKRRTMMTIFLFPYPIDQQTGEGIFSKVGTKRTHCIVGKLHPVSRE